MLNNEGFDLWADGYDKTVSLSEASNEYPFAGYKDVLNTVYKILKEKKGSVLDIGFGTGVLTRKLYNEGYHVTGIDFSKRMIEIAREKMPEAALFQHDFTNGFPDQLGDERFDWIIGTYAIHHLDDQQKTVFINELMNHVSEAGMIIFGDVAFSGEHELKTTRNEFLEIWDDDEYYLVAEKLVEMFPNYTVTYYKVSFCSGVVTISQQ